ncbi:hypothetical protein ACLOJK_021497 [Asimina triloba]
MNPICTRDLSGGQVFGASLKERGMFLPARLLHKIVVNSILPKMGSKEVITADDASVMWCAIKGFKGTLPRVILNHVRATLPRKDSTLPYGMLTTRILEYFEVELEGELVKKPGRDDFIDELTVKKKSFKKDGVRAWILKNEPPLASSPQAGQEIAEEDAIQGGEETEGDREEEDAIQGGEEIEGNRAEENALHAAPTKAVITPTRPNTNGTLHLSTQTTHSAAFYPSNLSIHFRL